MAETIFTLTSISWLVLLAYSIEQLSKTFDEDVEKRLVYVKQIDSYRQK
jgi:hypothetical protein